MLTTVGLYGERVGALSFVLSDEGAAKRVLSQLKRIARAIYSNPPVHGARIVAEVVGNEDMFTEWKQEMEGMAGRIKVTPAVPALHASCQTAYATMFLKVACLMHVVATAGSCMQTVRKVLRDHLEKINPDKDWSFITSQIGMFSFTGLTPPQVSVQVACLHRNQQATPATEKLSTTGTTVDRMHEPASVPANPTRPHHGLFMHL